MGTASAEGQGPVPSLSLCSCRGLCHTPNTPPGLGSFPRLLEGCCAAGHREHRDVLDALRAVELLSALQDQPFITCSCLISCSLAANLLKGCFL